MAVSVQKAVDDILECPICIETMNDTRVLPCIHTFCLKCIQKYGNDTIRDEQISCPCCRKSCPFPGGGLEELPKNILVEKLLEIRTSLVETTASNLQCSNGQDSCVMTKDTSSSRLCQIPCHNGKGNSSPLANSYCTECKSYMCSDCWIDHTQQSGTGSHLVLPIGCSEHPESPLEFYCKTCKMPICDACCSSIHRRHKCSSLSGYVSSMQSEIKLLKSQIFHKEALELENQTLKSQISHTEALRNENQTLKSQISHKEALERENQTLKSQISHKEALECENQTLKSQISQKEALERENQTLKSQIVDIKRMAGLRESKILKPKSKKIEQLESVNAVLKSRLANYQREIENFKAKEALARHLKYEMESLKTKIAELSQQKNNTEPTPTECHHLSSFGSWESRENDCKVHSCEQLMLLCRCCKNELCLTCFRLGLISPMEHKDDARSFLVLTVVILTGALTYVLYQAVDKC